MLPVRRRLPGLLRHASTSPSPAVRPHHFRRRPPTPPPSTAAPLPLPLRDRGLDHAVEKEKHLLPFHNLTHLLTSSPTPSLPLPSIAALRSSLLLPLRPIDFIRLYPHAFLEEPSPASPPQIRPSPALLSLHAAEALALDASRPDTADRLLRLLMLSPSRSLPIPLLDRLRWDLGIPRDSLLPDFPHYFSASTRDLDLVCYIPDLAVSAMERQAARTGGHTKSAPLSFPISYPRRFTPTNKLNKQVDEFQNLPYVSPYADGSQLKGEIAEKWTVGVVHELLHLTIGKKTEMDNLELLAKHFKLRGGFGNVIAKHPGIFYISSKLKTKTVVLREAYRRDLLVETHPLIALRYQYIHLMHKGKDGTKKGGQKSKKMDIPVNDDTNEYDEDEGGGGGDDDDDEDEDEDEDEEEEEDAISEDSEDDESDDEDVEYNAVPKSGSPCRGGLPRTTDDKRAIPRGPSRTSTIDRNLRTSKSNIQMKQHKRVNYRGDDQRPSHHRRGTSV